MDHRVLEVGIFSHYKIIAYQSNYYYILQLDFISLLLSFKGGSKTEFDIYSKFVSSWNYTVFNYLVYVCITDSFFLHFRKSLVALNQRRMPSFSSRILACVWLINWGKKIFGSLNEKLMRAPALGILVNQTCRASIPCFV